MEEEVKLYSTEAEQSVVGSILDDGERFSDIEPRLNSDEFHSKALGLVYSACKSLSEEGKAIDIITVSEALGDSLEGIGGMPKLAELANAAIPENADEHIEIIKSKAMLRRIVETSARAIETAKQGGITPEEVLRDAEGALADIESSEEKKDFVHISEALYSSIDQIDKLYHNDGSVTGTPTKFDDLDRMLAGLQKSDLIIVAARPSVGKTAFALNLATNVAEQDKTVAMFSLEMGAEQLTNRILSATGNIDGNKLRTGELSASDWEDLMMISGKVSEYPIYIDDSAGVSIGELRNKCRRLKRQGGLDLIVIDYLQLMTGRGDNRQQEVAMISRELKKIARELDVPVIALSQLSRGVEQREDKRPMLSDLRESGSIEQDADIVMFLYRDDYYNKESEQANTIEIIVAKQRNGPTGTTTLAFVKEYGKFLNIDWTQAPRRSEEEWNE